MRLEPTETGFQIDAGDLASMFGLARDDVQHLMREGQISSLSEAGQDADEGRHRITFRYRSTRVRLTVNTQGDVLLRTRTSVVPRSGAPIGHDSGSDETTARPDRGRARPVANTTPIDDAGEQTRYIETRYHARHRSQLRQLILLAEMVEDLHTGDEGNPVGLSGVLHGVSTALEAQLKETEQILFPAIRKGALSGIEASIAVMRAKHRELDHAIAQVRTITQDFTLPDDACASWATLYAGLAGFIEDMVTRARLENEILLPQTQPCGPASIQAGWVKILTA